MSTISPVLNPIDAYHRNSILKRRALQGRTIHLDFPAFDKNEGYIDGDKQVQTPSCPSPYLSHADRDVFVKNPCCHNAPFLKVSIDLSKFAARWPISSGDWWWWVIAKELPKDWGNKKKICAVVFRVQAATGMQGCAKGSEDVVCIDAMLFHRAHKASLASLMPLWLAS
jgi:hypothetical protein